MSLLSGVLFTNYKYFIIIQCIECFLVKEQITKIVFYIYVDIELLMNFCLKIQLVLLKLNIITKNTFMSLFADCGSI